MSSITIEELKKLPAESYQIIDVRDEIEISHGAVKGALACKPEEIMENPEVDKTRKLVICCSRGINSKEIAKKLEEEGLDAVSLEKVHCLAYGCHEEFTGRRFCEKCGDQSSQEI